MSQDHEQQQERIRLRNETKALYQATRRANPVLRSLEQSSDTGRKRIAREVPGVREHETEQRAIAREVPGVTESGTKQSCHRARIKGCSYVHKAPLAKLWCL